MANRGGRTARASFMKSIAQARSAASAAERDPLLDELRLPHDFNPPLKGRSPYRKSRM